MSPVTMRSFVYAAPLRCKAVKDGEAQKELKVHVSGNPKAPGRQLTMSSQAETSNSALVRSVCYDLAPVTAPNPLLSRGIADLVGREPARGASGLARVVDEARLVVQGILQRLVDAAGDRGYLTYHEVREPIGFEIYRIEPDADLKTLPESPLNRESLKQLLAALEERDIEVIPDELEFVFDSEFGGDTYDAWREWREVEEAERVLRENPRNPDLCERFALLLLSCTHGSSDELQGLRITSSRN